MTAQLPEFVQAMLSPQFYPDSPEAVQLVQTQMSFVFLAGLHVYKVKKPVDLGYLDYSTLEKRRYFCDQEVILNRRLCPAVYLGVVPITRDKTGIALAGAGETIEYAVKMVRLPHGRMLDTLLENNGVVPEMIDRVAAKLTAFYATANASPRISAFGKIETLRLSVDENFAQTEKYFGATITPKRFSRIKDSALETLRQKAEIFAQRVTGGRIRDCHGDLHCQHVCFLDDICIIDCIEFNDRFRYIDVAADLAFLAMDLDHYGRADLARRLVNTFSELSHDRQVPDLLKFYKGYRAYVRGKVNSFMYADPYISAAERQAARETAQTYFELSESYSRPRPFLFITVGLVGSGKSTVSQALARRLGLTIVSSDTVRKTLAGVPLTEHHFAEIDSGIYSAEFSRRTYDQMFTEARAILAQGGSVMLDATFIRTDERRMAQRLASEIGAEFAVIECVLDEENTRQRLAKRLESPAISDGRWEIYAAQKNKFEPVAEVPAVRHFIVDSGQPLFDQLTHVIDAL